MRHLVSGVFTFSALFAATSMPLPAAEAPVVFVVPGKAGVPVIINGVDASYTVVEGDWGLARPGHVTPTIITPPLLGPAPDMYGGYFPARGVQPGYGRHEIEPPPNRRLPRPAPSFHREWSTQSNPVPASRNPPAQIEPEVEVQVPGRSLPHRRNDRDDGPIINKRPGFHGGSRHSWRN
jgi:hypothetical protein